MPSQNSRVFGTGPTADLSLRVSAAVLVKVTLLHPESGQVVLALERKATLQAQGVRVSAQPFGGGSRLNRPDALLAHIPDFHYDSEQARSEQDFRILVRPQDWERVKRFCVEHFRAGGAALEADPLRELAEEGWDALKFELAPRHYRLEPLGLLAENRPSATENIHAGGLPTARIYSLFEARIIDAGLSTLILEKSAEISDDELGRQALADAENGGRGRANSVLALTEAYLTEIYQGLPAARRSEPLSVDGHALSGNVATLLADVVTPKYERL